MLLNLNIQNVVLIDRLNIAFERGLCVLTGETGAGKSILLDALGLALGARSESTLVRTGEDQAQVVASFEIKLGHKSLSILKDAGLEPETSLILRRTVTSEGRSKAYINDQPVSIGLLREIGDTLVEIHGQFETQSLLNPFYHLQLLDAYAGANSGAGTAWSEWKQAEKDMTDLRAQAEKLRSEETYLRQSLEDLDAFDPKKGEEAGLAALRDRLMHKAKIMEGLQAAHEALAAEGDPVARARTFLSRIESRLGESAAEITGALDSAAQEIQRALSGIRSLCADLEEQGQDLESVDERLHALRSLARKHQCGADDLPGVRQSLAERLDLIEHGDEALQAAIRKVSGVRKNYVEKSSTLREARKVAAKKLDHLVNRELPPLKLDKVKFSTFIEALEEPDWGPNGMDKVRFLVSTNPGAPPGPLHKIASGGEMARLMLALKVVLAQVGTANTLIFDEVDSGIGGAAAAAVGERLSRLAGGARENAHQILVVTHSPQVAARASHHYRIQKNATGFVRTDIARLSEGQERREEIARMLSGASITPEARAAADKLLETGT